MFVCLVGFKDFLLFFYIYLLLLFTYVKSKSLLIPRINISLAVLS